MDTIEVMPHATYPGKTRLAVDWSRVVAITERSDDGTAHLMFDYRRGEPEMDFRDWLGVALPFDEAVRRWRAYKGENHGRLRRAIVRVSEFMP